LPAERPESGVEWLVPPVVAKVFGIEA
jgi:hypothetical protein